MIYFPWTTAPASIRFSHAYLIRKFYGSMASSHFSSPFPFPKECITPLHSFILAIGFFVENDPQNYYN